jgi:PBSX family phage terminase large subunit
MTPTILKPNPGQQEYALRQPYSIFEILYGGSRGGGKTWAGLIWLTEYIEHPRFQGLVIRRNADDLSDWIERARYVYKGLGAEITGKPGVIRFPSGAIIRLGHLKDDSTYTKYQGHEYQKVLIEELTQIQSENRYLKLISSCRSTIPELRPQVFATTNPGNIGHLWVKQRFIDPAPSNKPFIDADGIKRIFIPATIDDNPVLSTADPDYVKRLDALKFTDEALYRAWRYGDWDIFVGQVYKEWRQDVHVIDKLPINLDICKKYIGFDWGYNDPASFHWIAVTPENEYGVRHYYVYRELYGSEVTPKAWAKEIADIVRDEPVEFMVMPHDTYAHLGGGNPIEQQFREVFREMQVHINLVPAEAQSHRAKINRQSLMHEALSIAPDGKPYLQIHTNCRNIIRTLPALPYDDKKPEEIDDNSEDHAFDSLTYGLYRITKGQGFITTSKTNEQRTESFVIDEQGKAVGLSYDPGQALKNNNTRDWRHI